jgi:hypothetical protein
MNSLYHNTNEIHLFISELDNESQVLVCDYIQNAYKKGVNIIRYPDKMTLIFEGDNENVTEFISELLFVCTPDSDFEEFDVPGLEKPTTTFNGVSINFSGFKEEKIFINGPYKGMKPSTALNKYGYISLIEMMKETPYNNEIKDSIIFAAKKFVKDNYKKITPEDVYNMSIESVKTFIKLNEAFLYSSIKEILSRAMYKDVDTFIKNASEEVLKSAYVKLARDLTNKFYV